MKIAFWSNANEMCSVSSNLAAISVACANRFPYSIITMENRLCQHNLGKAYNGGLRANMLDDVGTNYYDGGGIEGLLRKIYRGDNQSVILKTYLKEIIHQHLYYIPQSKMIHNEIFDYEFDHSIDPLFRMIEKNADICFIDTASNHNLSTKIILEESDLIVVNLCQKPSILEDFFLNYSSLISKAVFLISNYVHPTMLGVHPTMLGSRQISKLFQIPWENIITIPFNEMYHNAYRNGNVLEFVLSNYSCPKEDSNYHFIQSIKKASYIIIKRMELLSESKEIKLCGR